MDQFQSCRYCGCTETKACSGRCYCVKPGYCSACAEKHFERLIDLTLEWNGLRGPSECTGVLAGRPCRIVQTEDGSLAVFDHIGATAFAISADGAYLAPQYDEPELFRIFGAAGLQEVA